MIRFIHSEWFKWTALIVVTAVLLYFVSPGLMESPYNEF
jgi:hypothetical protein